MKAKLKHIRVFLLLLMLLMSAGSYAKVTYHILTKPITTKQRPMTGTNNIEVDVGAALTDFRTNVRVEAFRCTSDVLTVGLPEAYKSPLVKNFNYYSAGKIKKSSTTTQLYGYNDTKYYLYSILNETNDSVTGNEDCSASQMAAGTAVADNSDIYVTYDYDEDNTICDLTGTTIYNVQMGNRFLCLNVDRNNRPGGMQLSKLTDHPEYFSSDDFCYIKDGVTSGKHNYFFMFRFKGEDPYNIQIEVAYDKGTTFRETDKNLNKTMYKEYRGASIFAQLQNGESNGSNMWLSSDDDIQWQQSGTANNAIGIEVPGYFRGTDNNRNKRSEMSPIFNSFALFNHHDGSHHAFAGTKLNVNNNNWQPSTSGQDGYLFAKDDNDIRMGYKTPSAADAITLWPVRTYTFNVSTPFGNTVSATRKWSDYVVGTRLMDRIPEELLRKYATINGTYREQALSTEMSTFTDAASNSGNVWLKYTSSLPFETLTPGPGDSYKDARWYTMRMNNENQYLVHWDGTSSFITGGGSNSNPHTGENSAEAQVAFIGDPYELKIISRATSETAGANRYMGCAAGSVNNTAFNSVDGTSGISSWEMMPESGNEGTMLLRQFNTYAAPNYVGFNYGAANNPPVLSTSAASRIKVVELEKKTYVYHIYNMAKQIAVKASVSQDVGVPLKLANIPEVIRSPFLSLPGVTINYYWTTADALAETNAKSYAPFDVTSTTNRDIYVRYSDMTSALANTAYNRVLFNDSQEFNVELNNEYLYYSSDNTDHGYINSKGAITDEEADNDHYVWKLPGGDPYAMKVMNEGANAYIQVSENNGTYDNTYLSFGAEATAAQFVVKSSITANTFEVMLATGDDVDASETYYNIGRNTSDNVKMYSNATYPHGYTQLRFLLTLKGTTLKTYHLIDKSGHDLVQGQNRDDRLLFPADWYSPLVETYHYYLKSDFDIAAGPDGETDTSDDVYTLKSGATELTATGSNTDIYVTYDTSSRVNLRKGVLYLLKYQMGDNFRQEDGADGLAATPKKAVYPYCNGDCNFFVYGDEQYEIQQQGAASTRTRWAWYAESDNNDPYHVKISSLQAETFNNVNTNAYFYTTTQNFEGEDHVVTSLAWPGITGVQPSEYMVLGSVGQYRLVTTALVDGQHQTVKSFEQYWKTYDTVKNKLLSNILEDADKGANPLGSNVVPTEPAAYRELLTGTDTGQYGFHSYSYWAYAKRFNGYNVSGETKKGWEEIEHWYQTVNMGEGYFDFVATTIDPVLILLDQHGWEIMRKPLPSSPDDPNKAAKYEAIGQYDSPMVKEYAFWATAKKRTGLHQYYQLDKRVGGSSFTSTSLTDLPPYGSENVFDAKGNLQDQYVTYIVKDEYARSYDPSTQVGVPFLIQQGDNVGYAADNAATEVSTRALTAEGASKYIIDNISELTPEGSKSNELWYAKPNPLIDNEMGYLDVSHDWGSNPNAYEADAYKNELTAQYINDGTLGKFSFSNGFDPYNIQFTNVKFPEKYMVTNATGATLQEGEGSILGVYEATPDVALGTQASATGTWYDSRRLTMTNATFMAVADDEGNIQLMPRFDHNLRMRNFSTLVTPTAEAGDPGKLKETQTLLLRPIVYNYHIIDNKGREALRYRSGGDLVPQTPDHFKSPLAKDFSYYKTLTETDAATHTYNLQTLADELTESLAKGGLTAAGAAGNDVFVRYAYDDYADTGHILKGKWFTMTLSGKDAVYDGGIKEGTPKPTPVDGDDKQWQWKLTHTPQSVPDPYAVGLYNRSQADVTEVNGHSRFALLNYYDSGAALSGGYTLAVAGTGSYTYDFLQGDAMTTSSAATTGTENDVKTTTCTYDGEKSKVVLNDDVELSFTYKVYTNGTNGSNAVKYGTLAISATQDNADILNNEYAPVLPNEAVTPLLNLEDYLYYEHEEDMGDEVKELTTLYGLYGDEVFVRYKPYNPQTSSYVVPNDKGTYDGHVARGGDSNDTKLSLEDNLVYNIVWYNDDMMKSDGTAIDKTAGLTDLQTGSEYEWKLTGSDPYAIKITDMSGNKIYNESGDGCTLSAGNATTFMILNREGYDYGVLAVTGDATRMLSDYGNTITSSDPNHFVIFALSTFKVIYHLVILKTNDTLNIPFRAVKNDGSLTSKTITGSSQRDLTSTTGASDALTGDKYQLGETINGQTYSFDAGHVSLGDSLEVPQVFYRPNVVYTFFVEGVYNDPDCASEHEVTDMNNVYKGLELHHMGDDTGLLGKTVRINIVYSFNGDLETNAGADFVRSVSENKWYTFESKTGGGTPLLMQYTNAWGMEVKEGRDAHYTNDYLWTPLGDPYGFKMYHRYTCVNSGEDNLGEPKRVMTTADFSENRDVVMGQNLEAGDAGYVEDPNCIYELLANESTTPGYFLIHPMANDTGTQYYFGLVDGVDGSGAAHKYVKLMSSGYTEFTFGLSEELMRPYYDRAGYVGGLTLTPKAGQEKSGKQLYEEAGDDLMKKQDVVYNPAYIVKYQPGYYRLLSPEDVAGIGVSRYASGYTHKLELNPNADSDTSDAQPLHFYEVAGTSSRFDQLKSKDGERYGEGFTKTNATQGEIPIPAVESDPASIFYFYEGSASEPISRIQTQGLYVKGSKGPGATEGTDERAKVVMVETDNPSTDATPLYVMDIGGGILLIHDNQTAGGRANLKYLSYDQTNPDHIYDLKLTHNTHTDHAKWLMQPANHLGLRIATNSGGDGGTYGANYNYCTFYAPFDIKLPDNSADGKKIYEAYLCDSKNSPWNPPADLHPKVIDRYNIEANRCPEEFRGSDKFVPAGTPVLLAIVDAAGYVDVTIPTSSPSPSLTTDFLSSADGYTDTRDNILSGQYLEQKLNLTSTERIYTFGLPFSDASTMTLDPATGKITATLPLQENSGIGFYLNANLDKESSMARSSWERNNWYVYNNKVYYHATGVGGGTAKPRPADYPFYVPVNFDDDELNEEQEELHPDGSATATGDGCVYDLSGRMVATKQMIDDGSWRTALHPGIYIINGRKIQIR